MNNQDDDQEISVRGLLAKFNSVLGEIEATETDDSLKGLLISIGILVQTYIDLKERGL